jgi:hypothetical protein
VTAKQQRRNFDIALAPPLRAGQPAISVCARQSPTSRDRTAQRRQPRSRQVQFVTGFRVQPVQDKADDRLTGPAQRVAARHTGRLDQACRSPQCDLTHRLLLHLTGSQSSSSTGWYVDAIYCGMASSDERREYFGRESTTRR